jgi:hypothetical protein
MKIFFITLLFLFFANTCMGQDTVYISTRHVPDTSFSFFLDSLKQNMVQDLPHIKIVEIKYNGGNPNRVPPPRSLLSPIFIINHKYFYQFDYGTDTSAFLPFIAEYFKPANIQSIVVYYDKGVIYGRRSRDNGAILVTLKKGTKFNPEVAGLKVTTKKKKAIFTNFIDW